MSPEPDATKAEPYFEHALQHGRSDGAQQSKKNIVHFGLYFSSFWWAGGGHSRRPFSCDKLISVGQKAHACDQGTCGSEANCGPQAMAESRPSAPAEDPAPSPEPTEAPQ